MKDANVTLHFVCVNLYNFINLAQNDDFTPRLNNDLTNQSYTN